MAAPASVDPKKVRLVIASMILSSIGKSPTTIDFGEIAVKRWRAEIVSRFRKYPARCNGQFPREGRDPLLKERSLSPLRKMQRYLRQGEAGEVEALSDLPMPRRWR